MMDSPEVDFGNCLPVSIASLRAGLSTGLSYHRADGHTRQLKFYVHF